MNKPILIGLNGKKGSGKNTVGEFIKDWVEENGQTAQLQGFADKLKLSFARIFVPDATLEESLAFTDAIKELGGIKHDTILPNGLFDRFGVKNFVSGREALQHYGTEAHREVFGDNFWVDQLLPSGEVYPYGLGPFKAPDADPKTMPDTSPIPNWVEKWSDDTDYAIVTDVRFPNEAERIKDLGGEVWEIIRSSLNDQEDAHASEKPLPRELVDESVVNSRGLDDLKNLVHKLMNYTHADDFVF